MCVTPDVNMPARLPASSLRPVLADGLSRAVPCRVQPAAAAALGAAGKGRGGGRQGRAGPGAFEGQGARPPSRRGARPPGRAGGRWAAPAGAGRAQRRAGSPAQPAPASPAGPPPGPGPPPSPPALPRPPSEVRGGEPAPVPPQAGGGGPVGSDGFSGEEVRARQ